jgi:hypothetical protein
LRRNELAQRRDAMACRRARAKVLFCTRVAIRIAAKEARADVLLLLLL